MAKVCCLLLSSRVQDSLRRTRNKPPYNRSSADHLFDRAVRLPDPQQEGKTMVQAMSLFNQLLQHFPKLEFAALVKKHNAERAAKGFSCRAQLVAMLFCQMAHADSLREICNGLACCLGKLVHLGIDVAPNKSTLAYATKHRPAKLYEEVFYT